MNSKLLLSASVFASLIVGLVTGAAFFGNEQTTETEVIP